MAAVKKLWRIELTWHIRCRIGSGKRSSAQPPRKTVVHAAGSRYCPVSAGVAGYIGVTATTTGPICAGIHWSHAAKASRRAIANVCGRRCTRVPRWGEFDSGAREEKWMEITSRINNSLPTSRPGEEALVASGWWWESVMMARSGERGTSLTPRPIRACNRHQAQHA